MEYYSIGFFSRNSRPCFEVNIDSNHTKNSIGFWLQFFEIRKGSFFSQDLFRTFTVSKLWKCVEILDAVAFCESSNLKTRNMCHIIWGETSCNFHYLGNFRQNLNIVVILNPIRTLNMYSPIHLRLSPNTYTHTHERFHFCIDMIVVVSQHHFALSVCMFRRIELLNVQNPKQWLASVENIVDSIVVIISVYDILINNSIARYKSHYFVLFRWFLVLLCRHNNADAYTIVM